MFEVGSILAEASERARSNATLPSDVHDRLTLLCRDLDPDAMSGVGRRLARVELVSLVANALLVTSEWGAEASAEPFERPPVVIAGLPRSGSTLLHHLLALDLRFQHVPADVAMRPLPGRGDGLPTGEEVAALRLRMLERLNPELLQAHPFVPNGPEECNVTLASWIDGLQPAIMFDVPSYFDRLVEQGPSMSSLAGYGRLLAHRDDGRRWLLKSPGHLGNYESLRSTVGPLTLVELERPLGEVLDSWASLVARTRRLFYSDVDLGAIRERWNRYWGNAVRSLGGSTGRDHQREVAEVVSLNYADLVADPIGTCVRVLSALGHPPMSDETRAAMLRFLQEDPLRRWGSHRY